MPLTGAALYAEHEDVLRRGELFERSPLSAGEREAVFDALMPACTWTPIHDLWRPNLPDAGDDHLVELAFAGGAAWIVTANVRDLGRGELLFDDLRIGTAGNFLDHYNGHERHNDYERETKR